MLVRRTDGSQNIDTYYVYNEYGQKAFVIPPKAVQEITQNNNTITQNILESLCYQYRHDGLGREVEKRLPGKEDWESVVYDGADRPILTQDVNLKNKGQWLFTKYDTFGRVAYTGILSGGDRAAMQSQIGSQVITETQTAAGFVKNGLVVYYTNTFLSNFATALIINYYDTYPRDTKEFPPAKILDQFVINPNGDDNGRISTISLPTASYVKNIEDDNWTKTYFYYDSKGRVVGNKSWNYLGGYTKKEFRLDFSGTVDESYTYHKKSDTDAEVVIKERFVYDDQKRLLKQYHKVNSQAEELLAENTYNNLGQLVNKKTGNTTGVPLQSIDQSYNIRGWITKVNDPTSLNGKLFAYELKYHNPNYSTVSTGKYNGNIAEIDWQAADGGTFRRYNYQYDALDRLKSGIYSEPNTTAPQNNYYNESLTYDVNGNIQTLKRNRLLANVGAVVMDNLGYTYTGNRLGTVTDASGNYGGYPDTSGNPISYDGNGNMIDHLDKGILQIDYNYLNLPDYVKFDKTYNTRSFNFGGIGNNVNTKYMYRADGVKVKKIYTYGTGRTNSETIETTDYLDGFQYTDNVLSFVPTSEGYYDFVQNNYIYNYTDQVGNIRLAYYKDASGNVKIDRTTNYYPFGLEFGGDLNVALSVSPNYRYSSQGQEKQLETGWSSYKWRNYDAAMGRFFSIDPLSEKYAYQSHYNFSENRVVDGRELEGLEWQSTKREQDLPGDPVEFAEMIAGGINSLRAAVANNVVRTANVVSNDAVRNKYIVDEDGSLTLLTGVPKESFKEKVANGALDWGTIALSIGGGPEGMLSLQGGKAPALKGVEEVKNLAKAGRSGKQARLRELGNDPKVSSFNRGWIKNELRHIKNGDRKTIRNPRNSRNSKTRGTELAHPRKQRAKDGNSYKDAKFQDADLHKLEHKYGGYK